MKNGPPNTQKSKSHPWHALSKQEVIDHYQSSLKKGLTNEQVKINLSLYGPNSIPEAKEDGPFKRFLAQFHNLLIYVLLAAAGITAAMQHWIDTFVILAVVLVNSIIGFIQEGRAKKAIEAIRNMLSPNAVVIRNGQRHTIASTDVVPGDLVLLDAGDRVPADLRLIETKGLKAQEAALTGESVPVEKSTENVLEESSLGDRTCMAYSGTLIAHGYGRGIVVATGENTEIGHISNMMSHIETLKTPLIRAIDTFARWLTLAIVSLSSLVFIVAFFLRDFSAVESFMAAVALSVAAIPEGLPAILTITLALGVQKMASRNAIIRKLPAVETLGSVSTICSDKTGTLTRNEMMVQTIALHDDQFHVTGVGLEFNGHFNNGKKENIKSEEHPILLRSLKAAMICGEAELENKSGSWQVSGDPMEGALIVSGIKAGLELKEVQEDFPRIDHIPFSSEKKYMATLHHTNSSEEAYIFIKGAPEKIIDMCENVLNEKGESKLDKNFWYKKIDDIAKNGERVLALAQIKTTKQKNSLNDSDLTKGMSLLGLFGLIDPPRSEAIEAVKECQKAGISVKMITGDHSGTAMAIGKQLGLTHTSQVLTGKDLDNLDDHELEEKIKTIDIFARTSPEHKLRIVQALQAHNQVVAMTGDGVNDAPALKQADVGVAMGDKGTESAKEASEIVLADDNFASIARAVREGRNVYDNLKKAISFLLPINGGESGSIIFAIILGLQLPLTPLQVLWVNMVSSVTLALALAFEPAEKNIMTRPPRSADSPVLTPFLIWRIIFVSFLFLIGIFGVYTWSIYNGHEIEMARTHAVNTLVVMEVFYLLSVRTSLPPGLNFQELIGTRAVIIACSTVLGLQLIFTYAPLMNTFFNSRPMNTYEGLIILAIGFLLYSILYAEKVIVYNFFKNQ